MRKPALLVAFLFLGCQVSDEIPFDAAKWRVSGAERFSERTTRGRMAGDLIGKSLFIGQTRHEVLALLGDPTQRTDGQYDTFVYDLGRSNSRLLSSLEFLIVTFDGDRVTKIDITGE